MPVATAYLGSSGNSIFLFKDLDETDTLSWFLNEGNPELFTHNHPQQSEINVPGLGEVQTIIARTLPTTNRILVAVSNSSSDLFILSYDGANWVVTNDGSPVETNLSATDGYSFDMAVRYPSTIHFGDHPADIETNAFTSTGTLNDAELLSFQIKPRAGGNKTIESIVVDINDVVGITDTDITGANLMIDSDGDGQIEAGETTSIGGTGNVSLIINGTGNIAFTTNYTLTSVTNVILTADISNVASLDTLNVKLNSTGITGTNTTTMGHALNSVHLEGGFSLQTNHAKLTYGSRDNHFDHGARLNTLMDRFS